MAARVFLPSRLSSRSTHWSEHLSLTVTPAGRAALGDLDAGASMVAVLRLVTRPLAWRQAITSLTGQFDRSEPECSRLLISAESRGWLSVSVQRPHEPLSAADFLRQTGLLSEARVEALARRLLPDAPLDIRSLARELAAIRWLRRAEAGFLARIGGHATWQWD